MIPKFGQTADATIINEKVLMGAVISRCRYNRFLNLVHNMEIGKINAEQAKYHVLFMSDEEVIRMIESVLKDGGAEAIEWMDRQSHCVIRRNWMEELGFHLLSYVVEENERYLQRWQDNDYRTVAPMDPQIKRKLGQRNAEVAMNPNCSKYPVCIPLNSQVRQFAGGSVLASLPLQLNTTQPVGTVKTVPVSPVKHPKKALSDVEKTEQWLRKPWFLNKTYLENLQTSSDSQSILSGKSTASSHSAESESSRPAKKLKVTHIYSPSSGPLSVAEQRKKENIMKKLEGKPISYYDGTSLFYLVKLLRDLFEHYEEIRGKPGKPGYPNLIMEIGERPSDFLHTFTEKFPNLVTFLFVLSSKIKQKKIFHAEQFHALQLEQSHKYFVTSIYRLGTSDYNDEEENTAEINANVQDNGDEWS